MKMTYTKEICYVAGCKVLISCDAKSYSEAKHRLIQSESILLKMMKPSISDDYMAINNLNQTKEATYEL